MTTIDNAGKKHTKDGSGHESTSTLSSIQIDNIISLMTNTDFNKIRKTPFTGTCPTAYDGSKFIYEFHTNNKIEIIDSCKTQIDNDIPLFLVLGKF